MVETRAYCRECDRHVLARSNEPAHILHFFLCLFCCAWFPVWMALMVFSDPYRCPRCGSEAKPERSWLFLFLLGILVTAYVVVIGGYVLLAVTLRSN